MSYNYEEVVWGSDTANLSFTSPMSFRLENILSAAKSLPTKTPKILEIGCGGGQFIRATKQNLPQADCVGCDISQTALDKAKSLNDGVRYDLCSDKLPYADNTFDLVLVLDVLEHVDSPVDFTLEAKRVLKPGGLFFVSVPCEGDNTNFIYWLQKFGLLKDITKQCAGHINQWSVKKWVSTINSLGLKTERLKFSEHVLGQSLLVFTFIMLRRQANKNPGKEVNNESFYIKAYASPLGWLFRVVRVIVNILVNIETRLLQNVRSSNLHALFRK